MFARLLFGYKTTQCLYVAAKLNIADHLISGPKSADELAALTESKPEPLYRVLRCLAALGIFNEDAQKNFSLNADAEALVTDSPNTLKDFVLLCGDELYKVTSALLYSVKTGLPAFDHIHGMNFWEYLNTNPENATTFHDAMEKGSDRIISEIISHYDFSPYQHIIDVGGGKGHILCGILSAYPNMHGTVYDLLNVKNAALDYIAKMKLSDRCKIVTGSFFDSVPMEGDVYLLKVVLHDWDDEHAVVILKNCQQKMSKNSKLIIIEKIIEDDEFKDLACLGDINMLATLTGKERNLAQFIKLLEKANLKFEKKIATQTGFVIIEAILRSHD